MIIPINDIFREKVNQHIKEDWAGPIIVTKGVIHNVTNYDGFICIVDGKLKGYVLYQISNDQCEILVLQSMLENHGIGTDLIKSVMDIAKINNCIQICLITTNDNTHAIRYYQKFGFELTAVYINAMDVSRKLKPSIPLIGNEGIPLKHEFEFSFVL